jgi:hypothetical protein
MRTKPSDLGCGRPYTLSAKGKLFVGVNEAVFLRTFIETYHKSGRFLLELIYGWWTRGGDHQVFAVMLVCPTRVSPKIQAEKLWNRVQAAAQAHAGLDWIEFAKIRAYHVLRALAGVEGRTARGPEVIQRILAELPLPAPLITPDEFARIYEPFPSERWRAKLTEQVVGMLRAFFSHSESARLENESKTTELNKQRASHPEFFIAFERLLRSQAAWQRACRALRVVRRELATEGVAMATVNACQIQAILERPDLAPLQAVVAEHSPVSLAPLLKCAWENRPIVERLLAGFAPASGPDRIETDLTRRLSSGNRIREIASDPYLATRLLELYGATIAPLPAEPPDVTNHVERIGPRMIHLGWRATMNAPSGSALAPLKMFFAKELAPFAEALRPIRTPVLKAESAIRDPWLDESEGWRLVEKRTGGIGNAIKLELRLPAVLAQPAQTVVGIMRGNIAFAKAAELLEPLNVLDGILQFRPNQSFPVSGDRTRKTYLKPQGLRLWCEGDLFFAGISTRRVTETLHQEQGAREEVRTFADGERVAVLHICPGGLRLGTLTVLERRLGQWRIVPFLDVVARSDAEAFTLRGHRRVLVHNTGERSHTHLHFDLNSLSLAIDAQTSKLYEKSAGPISLEENRENLARLLPVKAALGRNALQKIAHRIGTILARNRVGHLILAGSGQISTRTGVPIPVRQFFALQSIGPRKVATGYLAYAAQKAGVGISTVSGRFALIDSRGIAASGEQTIVVGVPFRQLKQGEKNFDPSGLRRTRRGAPEHLHVPNSPDRIVDFSRNAAHSILRAWTDEEFRRRGLAVLQKMDLRSIELPLETKSAVL